MTPDGSIDVVLNALRKSDPPQGFDVRIQQALRMQQEMLDAAEKPHRSTLHAFPWKVRHPERSAAKSKDLHSFPAARMHRGMRSLLACAVTLLLIVAVRMAHTHPASSQTSMTAANAPSPARNLLQPTTASTATAKPQVHKPTHPPGSSTSSQPPREEVAVQTHEYIPEPPLPLTEQERLVLRMMHRDHSPQLAAYTPDARAERLHEDAKAYRDYFAAQPLNGQPIYDQHIPGGSR